MKYSLGQILSEYSEKNSDNIAEPVAVGKYGIRKRSEIYKKDLASDYSKNKLIFKDTITIGLGSKQIGFGVLKEDSVFSVSPAYKTFKINTTIISSAYLECYLKANNSYYTKKYMIASARQGKKVDIDNLLNEKLDIPSLDQQKELVSNLAVISSLIEKDERLIELFDELVKSRFLEMFGDAEQNPFNWVKSPMGNYMTLLTDFSANGSYEYLDSNVTMYDEPNYALMVRTTDLEKNDFETGVKYIDERAYNILSKSKIYGNEIIMNKIGSAGKVYLMPVLNRPVSLGRNAFMFRFNEKINIVFLYYLLTTEYGTNEIQRHVRGAVTKTITKDSARSVRIIIPPLDLQVKFASFVEQTNKLKEDILKRLELYEELLKKKMSEYFNN